MIEKRTGMALVVTLAMLVLVTVAAMAFFARATANRSIEAVRSNQVIVSQVLESGQDHAISGFLQGMTNRAVTNTVSGITTYRVTNAAGMLPERLLAQNSLTTNAGFRNLVRQSAPGADPDASTDNTATPSRNGRVVRPDRWNAPALLAGGGFDASRENELPTWIYLNKGGTVSANATAESIGRFAFNAYQVGGLLDANLAGAPAGLGTGQLAAIKPTQAGADLSAIPGISAPFMAWRYPGGAAGYVGAVRDARRTGFLQVDGARMIAGRRDLIRLADLGAHGLTRDALPYLTHFQRAVNAPGWNPATPAGSSIDYAAQADDPASANRFVPNVRVQGSFPRADGTQAVPGEPLLARRFALSRIRGIGRTGVDSTRASTLVAGEYVPATAATIQRDFGLVWSSTRDRWEYHGATGTAVASAIKTLATVAGENREPDFFETLKAAILSGALGKSGGNANSQTDTYDRKPDYQIIQIGANIIDQFRAGDYPVEIAFDDTQAPPFLGVVNLPGVNKIARLIYRQPAGTTTLLGSQPSFRPHVGAWFVPEFWRLHEVSALAESGATPAKVRLRAQSGDQAYLQIVYTTNHTSYPGREFSYVGGPTDGSGNSSGIRVFSSSSWVEIDASTPSLSTPRFPTSALSATSGESTGAISDPGGFGSFFGIPAGAYNCPDTRIAGTPAQDSGRRTQYVLQSAVILTDPLVTFFLEYEDAPGGWKTLDLVKNFDNAAGTGNVWELGLSGRTGANNGVVNSEANLDNIAYLPADFHAPLRTVTGAVPASAALRCDPRGDRFGTSNGFATQAGFNRRPFQTSGTVSYADPSVLPRSATGYDATAGVRARGVSGTGKLLGGSGWTPSNGDGWGNSPFALGTNTAASALHYEDNDGILRRAAGAYTAFSQDDATMKPVMLNREFSSPGDLGFAHRGEPWKDIDFFTPESGDAGLLEFFSVDEEPAVVAGRVNLNAAPPEVIEALLSGTILDESNPALPALSAGQADSLATALSSSTSASPFTSLADMVTAFSGNAALNAFPVKRQREAPVRVLSSSGDTRTWNLLIDVIAQSGRFEPGAHRVDAEARRWVHVALDRLTGRIIALQTENIPE